MQMSKPNARARAYSYTRFSTPEQEKGDSLRRQTQAARDYARRNGLELDETLTIRDPGVSGFRGKNFQKGALGAFVKAVESGKIRKGSYLLVENFDRLSRIEPFDALDQFRAILKLGIRVVTLTDSQLYTAENINELPKLLNTIMQMYLANMESVKKGERVGEAWRDKRDRARTEGHKQTRKCPAWLRLNPERTAYVPDKTAVKAVRRIFELALAGHGKNVIVRRLNQDGIKPIGRARIWHGSYVEKILTNDAVIGIGRPGRIEHKDGKKRRVLDDPIPSYYPAVIDRALFEKVRRARATRLIPAGRKGEAFSNLFTGLVRCSCGAPLHYVNKGAPPKGGAYLCCARARDRAGNCRAPAWRYGAVESLLILSLENLDYAELFPDLARDARAKLEELEDSRLELASEREQAETELENLAIALGRNPNQPALEKRLNRVQSNFDDLTRRLAALENELETERDRAKNSQHDFRQIQDGLERLDAAHAIPGPELYDLRARLNQMMKRTIGNIEFHNAGEKDKGEWRGQIQVTFESTDRARTLYMGRDYRECHSVPVNKGKEDWKRARTFKLEA